MKIPPNYSAQQQPAAENKLAKDGARAERNISRGGDAFQVSSVATPSDGGRTGRVSPEMAEVLQYRMRLRDLGEASKPVGVSRASTMGRVWRAPVGVAAVTFSTFRDLFGHAGRALKVSEGKTRAGTILRGVLSPLRWFAIGLGKIFGGLAKATGSVARAPAPTLREAASDSEMKELDADQLPMLSMNREAYALARGELSAGKRTSPFDVIVVPGFASEAQTAALHPKAVERLIAAIADFRAGAAPFIMVSGGNVHPKDTPHNEALEMRRFLLAEGIPAERIIVEPNAQHSTTNLRNAGRLMKQFGFERGLVTSSANLFGQTFHLQTASLPGAGFDARSRRHFGYTVGKLSPVDERHTAFIPADAVLTYRAESDALDP